MYCASSTGSNPDVIDATTKFGALLARENIELVYGGGAVGLMGLIADTVLNAGGRVTGIIPTALFPREVGHAGVSELVEVESMHQRKMEMFERSDAFVALPGGFGTLEELAEVTTWAQIGVHGKPIGILNVDGFWDPLLALFDRAVSDGLLKPGNRRLIIDRADPDEMLAALRSFEPHREPKWLDLDQT